MQGRSVQLLFSAIAVSIPEACHSILSPLSLLSSSALLCKSGQEVCLRGGESGAAKELKFWKNITVWNVSKADIEKGLRLWDKDEIRAENQTDVEVLAFLYSKGVMSDEESAWRKLRFQLLLKPEKGETEKSKSRFFQSRNRLNRILENPNDINNTKLPPDVQSWDEFVKECPLWNEPGSHVFHRDDPSVRHSNRVLIQRRQEEGLCYLTAPAVTQHYKVCKTTGTKEEVPTVDIRKYIRSNFDEKSLEEHIFDDSGGNSMKILYQILHPGSYLVQETVDRIDISTLQQYGPALVSAFSVHEDFELHSGSAFIGKPVGDVKGIHAMVLIGVRGEGSERKFLLQNWWRRCQFVEVDLMYLKECTPHIFFVGTPQESIPSNFPAAANLYDETSFVDKPESERHWGETRVNFRDSFKSGACNDGRLMSVLCIALLRTALLILLAEV
jgi:hypothetical protein